jgi:ankyrin repeat protein
MPAGSKTIAIPFLDAALKGHARTVERLFAAGMDVNVQDPRGTPWNRTALMHAAEKGHLEVVKLLIKAGASIDAIDKGIPGDAPGGNTALLLAISGPQADGRPAHLEIAHRLLDAGASPKKRGGGTSVINAAAYLGDKGLFQRLIDLGADTEQRDASGRTAISSAVANGSVAVVDFLLTRGTDPNSRMPGGAPALVDAALERSTSHLRICKSLIEAGADPNRGDEDNFTPLMAACRCANLETARHLISLPVRVNEIERNQELTALDIILKLQEPRDIDPAVLARLKKLGEPSGYPPSRLKAIERLLRRAGAKTLDEILQRKSSKKK